jgi:hypothetical protein
MTRALTADPYLWRLNGFGVALIRRRRHLCPKMSRKPDNLRQKRHSKRPAARDKHLSSGIMADFDDNGLNGIVAFGAQYFRADARLSIGSAQCRRSS